MSDWESYFNAWLAWHEAVLRYQAELQSLVLTRAQSPDQLHELRKDLTAKRDAMKSAAAALDQQEANPPRKRTG